MGSLTPLRPTLIGSWYDQLSASTFLLKNGMLRVSNGMVYRVMDVSSEGLAPFYMAQYINEEPFLAVEPWQYATGGGALSKQEPKTVTTLLKFRYTLYIEPTDVAMRLSYQFRHPLFANKQRMLLTKNTPSEVAHSDGTLREVRGEQMELVLEGNCCSTSRATSLCGGAPCCTSVKGVEHGFDPGADHNLFETWARGAKVQPHPTAAYDVTCELVGQDPSQ